MHVSRVVRSALAAATVVGLFMTLGSQGALAGEPGVGELYFNGHIVGTVVPPAHVDPGTGKDPFFKVTNGVSGQLGIAGVGPGEPGFNGGDWEVFTVTFKVSPYLLTSGADVAAAQARGDVTVTRQAAQDFRCPITSTAVV